MLGLRFCARALSSCGKRGSLFIAVHGPLTVAASPVAEHRLQMHRLSSCDSRAQLLRGMWDLPRPGLEPVPLHWQADSQPLRHQGSPYSLFFNDTATTEIYTLSLHDALPIWDTLHRGARASHCRGLSCCEAQAPDAQAQQLWLTGLVAPRHVGSSQTRARTRSPALAGRFSTTAPPGKPWIQVFYYIFYLKTFYICLSLFEMVFI